MSQREALSWAQYIAKRGSLNIGKRIEQGIARLAVVMINTQGGKAEMIDFMPYADRPKVVDSGEPATIQQAFNLLKALKKAPV